MKIVDQFGIPFQVNQKTLSSEMIRGEVRNRNYWSSDTVAQGLTPERLSSILQSASDPYYGDANAYLTLAEIMEERNMHYAAVLGTRKRAVSGLDIVIEAASDSTQDIELADSVREIVKDIDCVYDLMDALGKGYSVVEMIWRTDTTPWKPRFVWRDPRFFRYDRETGQQLQILKEDGYNTYPIPPGKFIVHQPTIKSGLKIRGGLARLVAFADMCLQWTKKDWMAYLDTYGVPPRIARYDVGTTAKDKEIALNALRDFGNHFYSVISKNMEIEFPSPPTGTGANIFENTANWWDKQISKAVLGQTMTTDDGASLSQAQVHNVVREDIMRADAKQLEETLNLDLVRVFIDINFGVQKAYPRLKLYIPKQEDIALLITALKELVPLGLRVEQSVIRDKLGIPDPEEDEEEAELLAAKTDKTVPTSQPPQENDTDENEDSSSVNRAMNRTLFTEAQTAVERLGDEAMEKAGDSAIDRRLIKQAIREASSREDLETRLMMVFTDPESHSKQFRETLRMAEFAAEVLGYVSAQEGKS